MIRRLFALYTEGRLGLRGVARQLEREGFLSPNTGKMYGYSTLQNILTNPKYKGFYCSRKTISVDFRDNRQRRMPEEEWIVYPDENIPAIVSEGIWDRANALFKQRGKKMKETGGSFSARYPLSGKLFCGEHAESYHRHIYKSKKNGEQEVWNCRLYRLKGKTEGCDSPTIYTSEIESILADVFRDIYENRETVIEQMVDIYSRPGGSRDFAKYIAAAEKDIAALNGRKDKLLDLFMDETITRAEFKKRSLLYDISTRREAIIKAFAAGRMRLVGDEDGRMVFRGESLTRTIWWLGEEAVTITRNAEGGIDIEGPRRFVMEAQHRIPNYVEAERENEKED